MAIASAHPPLALAIVGLLAQLVQQPIEDCFAVCNLTACDLLGTEVNLLAEGGEALFARVE